MNMFIFENVKQQQTRQKDDNDIANEPSLLFHFLTCVTYMRHAQVTASECNH